MRRAVRRAHDAPVFPVTSTLPSVFGTLPSVFGTIPAVSGTPAADVAHPPSPAGPSSRTFGSGPRRSAARGSRSRPYRAPYGRGAPAAEAPPPLPKDAPTAPPTVGAHQQKHLRPTRDGKMCFSPSRVGGGPSRAAPRRALTRAGRGAAAAHLVLRARDAGPDSCNSRSYSQHLVSTCGI